MNCSGSVSPSTPMSFPWGQLALVESGRGEPCVVLLHGTGCDNADWQPVLPHFPRNLHWIAMEFRGHGASDTPTGSFQLRDLADDVICLLQARGLAHVVLAGHSLGGMVAMEVASRSTPVTGLALLEAWTSLHAASIAFTGERFFGALPATTIAAIRAKHAQVLRRFTPSAWATFWQSVERFDGLPYLQTARIPIAAIYGDAGRTPDTERHLRIPPNPNIHLGWAPACGHYLPLEDPAYTAAMIQDVVQRARCP